MISKWKWDGERLRLCGLEELRALLTLHCSKLQDASGMKAFRVNPEHVVEVVEVLNAMLRNTNRDYDEISIKVVSTKELE